MLPIEKNKDLAQQIERILRRMDHIKQVKTQLFDFITEVQQLYSSFSQKIHKEMMAFEQKIVKNSLYSTQKSNYIINMAKIYREFSMQLERNSKINVINLQRIKHDQIVKQEQKLKKKCQIFQKQFQQYIQSQKSFNKIYQKYAGLCNSLDQTILSYRSYENPLSFYNQTITNVYLGELQRKFTQSSGSETGIITDIQVLDQKRKWMSDHIKQINQLYVILLHIYLVIIESIIQYVVDPKKQENIEKGKLNLRSSEMDSLDNQQMIELQRLDNLFASETGQNGVDDSMQEDYSELFKKNFSADDKFFFDRCQTIRVKKIKSADQVYKIQMLLVQELKTQRQNYYSFQKEYKAIEKDIFTNNGIDSFQKKFRKYFGSNFMEIQELCFVIIERQKKSLQKICKSMEDSQEKMKKMIEMKKDCITNFQKRSKVILDEHLKLKQKTYSKNDSEQLQNFKTSITQSFNQLKKIFLQLQKSERQIDKMFFNNLKSHYETILKEAINKNLTKLLEKEKNRVTILKNINIDTQIIQILKEDSRYEMLLNECPKPNLYATFQSRIKKKQYEQTKILLQKKQTRLKSMLRSKQGCCGIKSEPIKNNILSSHECKLLAKQQKYKGQLSITAMGVIFEQKSWLPFYDNLMLMIPASDLVRFDIKSNEQKPMIEIETQFGSLTFDSQQQQDIITSMQKNIVYKPGKQGSIRGDKKNDSSSFIKSTTNQFKMSFSNDATKTFSNPGKDKNQKGTKPKSGDALIKDLAKKWRDQYFLSVNFTPVIKTNPPKSQQRRDYTYKNQHSKFYLKERRSCEMEGKILLLKYQWKISFPDSPMLHSFKHHQKIRIQNTSKDLRIHIITAKYYEEQLYIKNKFYKQIEEMNTKICQFIGKVLQKNEADVVNEPEEDANKSVDSCNIVIDDINVEDRQSKFQKTQSLLKNSRVQKMRSSGAFGNQKSVVI